MQEAAIATEDLLGAVTGDDLEDGVDVDNRVVRLECVGDDDSAWRLLQKKVLDGKRERAIIGVGVGEVERSLLFLLAAQIRVAVPLHSPNLPLRRRLQYPYTINY